MAVCVFTGRETKIDFAWLVSVGFRCTGGGFMLDNLFIWENECGSYSVQISGVDRVITERQQVLNLCDALGIQVNR